jgi:hypothetical protein
MARVGSREPVSGMGVVDVANRSVGVVSRVTDSGLVVRLDDGRIVTLERQVVFYVAGAVQLICNWDNVDRYILW